MSGALAITAAHRLRGSDAVAAAVARPFAAALVTLDAEQTTRDVAQDGILRCGVAVVGLGPQ